MLKVNSEKVFQLMPLIREGIKTKGKKMRQEREEKDRFFAKRFTRKRIPELDQRALRELIQILWAYRRWANKDYLYREMLKSHMDIIQKAFTYLLFDDDPIDERFDHVLRNVRMMGPAGISEILAHHDCMRFPIWSQKAKKGLIALGVPVTMLPKSRCISGNQYKWYCGLMRDLYDRIKLGAPEVKDFFDLDFLLLYLATPELVELPDLFSSVSIFDELDHDRAVQMILELGEGLGFQVRQEVTVSRGCKIDAVWVSRVGNLGTISYAFEVHRRGSRDSAILNLQRVWRDPSIQKVYLVSTERELGIFAEEISSLDENFKRSVGYLKVEDLYLALDRLKALKEILNSLGLLATGALSVAGSF
ncbi:hypothetical protein JXM67_08070 [candidate division WOR-3 bacterium]|nr:hypothetical protein [candidate division WOR-3 bacterium]